MKCPKCSSVDDKVVDSRSSKESDSIRRRRECLSCGFRFTTYETVVHEMPVILKRNGSRQPFDQSKLLGGMVRACEKRPVAMATLEESATEIAHSLRDSGIREIPSKNLGALVYSKLGEIDGVACIRYASVHHDFQEETDFITEIEKLKESKQGSKTHPELFGNQK